MISYCRERGSRSVEASAYDEIRLLFQARSRFVGVGEGRAVE